LKGVVEDKRDPRTQQPEEMYGTVNTNNSMLMYHRVQNMGVDFDNKRHVPKYDRRSLNNTTVTSASGNRKRAMGYKQRPAMNQKE
jgi:hypothetical protein